MDQCLKLFSKGHLYSTIPKSTNNPQIVRLSSTSFQKYLSASFEELPLDPKQNGIIKIHLIFTLDSLTCVQKFGCLGLQLDHQQINDISDGINCIVKTAPGSHSGMKRNCLGILYVEIKNGSYESFRNINFDLME